MNKKEKTIIILLIFILVLVAFGSFATYAYFKVREYRYGNFEIELTSKGVDTLEFVDGKNANININFNNFMRNFGHDVSDDAILNVKLNTSKEVTEYCYKVDVVLPDENVFLYTDEKPELVLTFSKGINDGNFQTLVENLDITETTGVVNIPVSKGSDDYIHHIKTTKMTEIIDNLKAKFTFKYKNIDQEINNKKSYNGVVKAYLVNCEDGSLYSE